MNWWAQAQVWRRSVTTVCLVPKPCNIVNPHFLVLSHHLGSSEEGSQDHREHEGVWRDHGGPTGWRGTCIKYPQLGSQVFKILETFCLDDISTLFCTSYHVPFLVFSSPIFGCFLNIYLFLCTMCIIPIYYVQIEIVFEMEIVFI